MVNNKFLQVRSIKHEPVLSVLYEFSGQKESQMKQPKHNIVSFHSLCNIGSDNAVCTYSFYNLYKLKLNHPTYWLASKGAKRPLRIYTRSRPFVERPRIRMTNAKNTTVLQSKWREDFRQSFLKKEGTQVLA